MQFAVLGQPFEHDTVAFLVSLLLFANTMVEVISVNAEIPMMIFFIFIFLYFFELLNYYCLSFSYTKFGGLNSDDKCLIILLSLNIKYCCLKIYSGGWLTITFGDCNQPANEQARKGLQSLFSLCCFLSCFLSQQLLIQFLPIAFPLLPITGCSITKSKIRENMKAVDFDN